MKSRYPPGDEASPIVADKYNGGRTDLANQIRNVGHQFFGPVGGEPLWLVRFIVASKIGSNRSITGSRESGKLMAPGIPKLGKPMQQEDWGTFACFGHVQL